MRVVLAVLSRRLRVCDDHHHLKGIFENQTRLVVAHVMHTHFSQTL